MYRLVCFVIQVLQSSEFLRTSKIALVIRMKMSEYVLMNRIDEPRKILN